MSSTSCGTGMLVLFTKVRSLFSLTFTTSSASSIGTCLNRLVTSKLTRRSSGSVWASCSRSTNLVEFITVYLVCPNRGQDSGKFFWPVYKSETQCKILPKVHKDGIPMWPIVSCIGSLTYRLAKDLVRILTPVSGQSMHQLYGLL